MTRDVIEKRLEGVTAKLNKRRGTLEKHRVRASKLFEKLVSEGVNVSSLDARDYRDNNDIFWTICDYENKLDDIERVSKEVKELEESKKSWETKLEEELERERSRDVKVILDFLDIWEDRVRTFILSEKPKYEEAIKVYDSEMKELSDTYWKYRMINKEDRTEEEADFIKTYDEVRREKGKEFHSRWSHVEVYYNSSLTFEECLDRELKREKVRKYDDLILRVSKEVGKIVDASYLRIDQRGNLNGFIIGELGKCSVNTIGAGGYNIQCYHYRTLIHKI